MAFGFHCLNCHHGIDRQADSCPQCGRPKAGTEASEVVKRLESYRDGHLRNLWMAAENVVWEPDKPRRRVLFQGLCCVFPVIVGTFVVVHWSLGVGAWCLLGLVATGTYMLFANEFQPRLAHEHSCPACKSSFSRDLREFCPSCGQPFSQSASDEVVKYIEIENSKFGNDYWSGYFRVPRYGESNPPESRGDEGFDLVEGRERWPSWWRQGNRGGWPGQPNVDGEEIAAPIIDVSQATAIESAGTTDEREWPLSKCVGTSLLSAVLLVGCLFAVGNLSILMLAAILLGAYSLVWLGIIAVTSIQGTATWTSGPDLETLLTAIGGLIMAACLLFSQL